MTWIVMAGFCALAAIGSLMAYAWFLTRGEPSPPTPYEIPEELWNSAQADRRARELSARPTEGVL